MTIPLKRGTDEGQSNQLEDLLVGEVWNITTFPQYLEECRKQGPKKRHYGYRIIDFTIIDNQTIRREFVDYCRNILLTGQQKLITFSHNWFRFKILIDFLNTLSISGSLLQYREKEVLERYKTYLTEKHYTLKGVVRSVTQDQKKKAYQTHSDKYYDLCRFYHFLQNRQLSALPEWEKDVWNVDKLPFYIEKSKSRVRHTLNFLAINQPAFRKTAKIYILARLKLRKFSTVCDDMKALKEFSTFLSLRHPEIDSLEVLTRAIMLEYIQYIREKDFSTIAYKQRIGFIRTFLENGAFMEIPGLPKKALIFQEDYRKAVKVLPRIIPAFVLDQLHQCLPQLKRPLQINVTLLENVGMRPNELCQLKLDCLKYDTEGDPYLEYYQSKTHCYNRIPISDTLADLIQEQQAYVKATFQKPVYLFQISDTKPIGQESVARALNYLSYDNHIVDESGKPYRFKLHRFRHTIATRYAREGMSPSMLREMLGHKSIRSMIPYTHFNQTLNDEKIQAFLKTEDNFLLQQLQGNKKEPLAVTPLPIGFCTNIELCDTALICYSCGMFSTDILDRDKLRRYRNCLQQEEQKAALEGHKRQEENLKQIPFALEKILKGESNGENP